MVGMALLLVVVGLVVVAAVGATGVRRRLADERHSVREYHQTLETLRHLSEGRPATAARAQPKKVTSARPTAAKEKAGALLASSGRPPRRGRAAAFAARSGAPTVSTRVDAPPPHPVEERPDVLGEQVDPAPVHEEVAAKVGVAAATEGAAPARAAQAVRELIAHPELHGPVRSRSMPGMGRRPRRPPPVAWTAVAVVVIAVVTAVALAMGPSHPSRSSAPPVTTAPPVKHLSATKPSASHRSSTAPAPPAALDPVTSSTSSATYDLPPSSATLTLAASGPCWVEATVPSTGQILWMGTLQSGQSQTIPTTSGALLRLGDANNVQVAVGGAQVHLPSGFALVFDMTFLPA